MKKLLIFILSVLFLFSCAAFTACKNNSVGNDYSGEEQGGSDNSGEEDDNSGGESGGSEGGSDEDGGENVIGAEYKSPAYDENLPQNYYGTYYLDKYFKVVNGKTVAVETANYTDADNEFSTEKYNVTVFSDDGVCLNFGGRADRRGVFLPDKKTLAIKRQYFSSMGSVETQYDENLKFRFLNGELVLLKTTNGENSQTLQVYNFKKGAALTEADYPVTVNSFNGVYAEKHNDGEDYIELTLTGAAANVKRVLHTGEEFAFDGAVVFRAEGDKYAIIIRYANGNGTHTKTIDFDYALGVTSNYDKIR